MTEAELKALTRALIAECTPDTLTTLEKALKAAQADPLALSGVATVVTVAREVSEDRAAQAQKAPAQKPGSLGEALALDAQQGRR